MINKQHDTSQHLKALWHRAENYYRKKDYDHSEKCLKKMLKESPGNVQALHLYSIVLSEHGNQEKAMQCINKAIEIKNDDPIFYHNRGLIELKKHLTKDAVKDFEQAIQLKPSFSPSLAALGNVYLDNRQDRKAIEFYKKTIELNPQDYRSHNNLGNAYLSLGEYEKAQIQFEISSKINPNEVVCATNLGVALTRQNKIEEALIVFKKALEINPNHPGIYNNMGLAYMGKNDFKSAKECYDNALKLKKDYPEAFSNLGLYYKELNHIPESIESYKKALKLKPDYPEACFNLALSYLINGDYVNGFKYYEARFNLKERQYKRYPFTQPQWEGQDLTDKTLVIYAEQGMGDTLQFSRYISMIPRHNTQIIFICQDFLIPLFGVNQLPVDLYVLGGHIPNQHFDYQIAITSLPKCFNTTVETIPKAEGYLKIPLIESLKNKIPATNHLKVGIVWSGSKTHLNDRNRSIPLEKLQPLLALKSVDFYSLQCGDAAQDLKKFPLAHHVTDLSSCIKDFSDSACLLNQLDLLISVDTAAVHLAGATGKPAWVLLSYSPDFRWMLNREDSPWYRSLRLFRQKKYGEWDDLIEEVTQAFKEKIIGIYLGKARNFILKKEFNSAKALYLNILNDDPNNFSANNNLGNIACSEKDYASAIHYYQRGISNNPKNAEIYSNLGVAFLNIESYDNAIVNIKKSLEIDPTFTKAIGNLGITYARQKKYIEAEHCYKQILSIDPTDNDVHVKLGFNYQEQGKYAEAAQEYKIYLKQNPDNNKIRSIMTKINLAMALMIQGNYLEGWPYYEARLMLPARRKFAENLNKPEWKGEDLTNKILLIYTEQGRGDTLMFSRLIANIPKNNTQIILQCQSSLVSFLQNQIPVDKIISGDNVSENYDYQVALASLAGIFKISTTNIPQTAGYLKIPTPHRLEGFIKKNPKKKSAGLVWSANKKSMDYSKKSLPFSLLTPLFELPNIQFYSLQVGENANDILALPSPSSIIDLTPEIKDFSDSAVLLSQLDLLITIDTAQAHLAGSLGLPAWVMLAAQPDFRWLLTGEDCIWYNSLKLFRQPIAEDWKSVIQTIKEKLIKEQP